MRVLPWDSFAPDGRRERRSLKHTHTHTLHSHVEMHEDQEVRPVYLVLQLLVGPTSSSLFGLALSL